MIQKYLDSNGEELWKVYVNVRSQTSATRTQKRLKGIKTEALAKKAELQLIRECDKELLLKESEGISWEDLLEKFELHIRNDSVDFLNLQTKADYIATIHKYTKRWFGKAAGEITGLDAKDLFQGIGSELSVGHQMKIKMILNKIFKFGIDYGFIKGMAVLPTVSLRFQKQDEKMPEILTILEIRKLLVVAKEMNHRWYPIWAFALLTGMRNGEMFALTWDDVDLENQIINLTKSFNKRTRETKCTKGGYWRNIPISSELNSLLRDLKLKSNGNKFVLPRITAWGMGYQAKELRAFCQSIGIPSIRFHALRACFATQLIRQGIPAIQIQKICGWKDLETMQRYIRLAGIEVSGVTENLKILPDREVMGEVVNLFAAKNE